MKGEKLPKKELINIEDESLNDDICEAINEYLASRYGYCVKSYCYEIVITDIEWDLDD